MVHPSEMYSEDKYYQELNNILYNLLNIEYNPRDIQKINTSKGLWFGYIDITKTGFMLLVSHKYPKTSAIRLLNEIQEEIQKINRYHDPGTDLKKFSLKNQITFLMKNYEQNPNYNDNFDIAQKSIDSLQINVEKNIKKLIDNNEKFDEIEKKTHKMTNLAQNFSNDSSALKRKFQIQNLFKCIAIVVVIAILLTIIILLIIN